MLAQVTSNTLARSQPGQLRVLQHEVDTYRSAEILPQQHIGKVQQQTAASYKTACV